MGIKEDSGKKIKLNLTKAAFKVAGDTASPTPPPASSLQPSEDKG